MRTPALMRQLKPNTEEIIMNNSPITRMHVVNGNLYFRTQSFRSAKLSKRKLEKLRGKLGITPKLIADMKRYVDYYGG